MLPQYPERYSATDNSEIVDGVADPYSRKSIRLTSPIDGLRVLYRGRRGVALPSKILHRSTWDSLLCEGVPISLRELVLLVVDRLGVPVDMVHAHKFLMCSWSLGWHITSTTHDGESRHYWGGGVTPDTSSNYRRGDWITIDGVDRVNGVQTSRLARVICGVQIHDVRKLFRVQGIRTRTGGELPDSIWETTKNKETGTVSFLLVRYAQAHHETRRQRGPKCGPLCPGVLRDTHCLWSWAERRPNFQRGCLQGRAWERNRKYFGKTDADQDRRHELESHAWYDVIQSSEILGYSNVQSDPDRDQSFLESVLWC